MRGCDNENYALWSGLFRSMYHFEILKFLYNSLFLDFQICTEFVILRFGKSPVYMYTHIRSAHVLCPYMHAPHPTGAILHETIILNEHVSIRMFLKGHHLVLA